MSNSIFVATVHWHSEFFIQVQLDALRRYLPAPPRLLAFLDGLPSHWDANFEYVERSDDLKHPEKLNRLASIALQRGQPEDVIMFIDGDALPVADLGDLISELERYPLIAVQRRENNGDIQPHPCFCITTLGYWKDIEGDWRPGGFWRDADGRRITDVGGRLLETLDRRGDAWKPLLRSNRRELHPLWFGVYGDVVYHHGAGFRDKLCRLDAMQGNDPLSKAVVRSQRRLRLHRRFPRFDQSLTEKIRNYMRRRNDRLSRRVMAGIEQDSDFARRLGLMG